MDQREKNMQDAILAEAAKESGDSTALVAAQMTTALTAEKKAPAYVTQLLETLKADFMEANDGLDMDFVYMGSWLIFDKKGNFYEKDHEDVKYGDKIDVVIGQGEKRWSLWGLENSAEDGMLIVSCREREDAVASLEAWLEANPDATARYSTDDLELRYMAYVVPVACLGNEDELPKVYIMSFAPTTTIAWGKYAMSVYNGNYSKSAGIPAKTGVNRVVTRLTTDEKKSTKGTNSWIGIDFEAVGLFNPADYGVVPETVDVVAEQ